MSLPENLPPVSLIIPARDEAESLPPLARRIPNWVAQVLVVDNASSDGTAGVARNLGFDLIHVAKVGYGAAASAGLQAAQHPIVAFASADGSDPVEHLADLIRPLTEGQVDLVMAKRQPLPGAMTLAQKYGNRLATALLRLRWNATYSDLGPFRALERKTLENLNLRDRGYGWTLEMQAKVAAQGLKWQEIPMPYAPRSYGRSKISGTWRGTWNASRHILWTFIKLALKRSDHA